MIHARAAIATSDGSDFALKDVCLDGPRDDEVVVRIEACGVCRTDAEARHLTPLPAVFGHEGVGIIEQVGARVRKLSLGDRVALTYPWCGQCPNCRARTPYFCDHNLSLSFSGTRADGTSPVRLDGKPISSAFFQQSSFATHAIATERNATRVADDAPSQIVAALTCGVMTGAGAVANTMRVKKGQSIVIFGGGAVGLSAAMTARICGAAQIVVIDVHENRLALASSFGATGVHTSETNVTAFKRLLPNGAHHVFDTTGQASVWELAPHILATGGQFGAVTTPEPTETWALRVGPYFEKFATLKMIIQGSSKATQMIPRMLKWRRQGDFPIDRLVESFPFAEINAAFAASREGRAIKPVLLMP
jgi:aryl-alcohol dehydrogenase